MVEVSAKQKTGLDQLLEMILLQAEVLELKADPHQSPRAQSSKPNSSGAGPSRHGAGAKRHAACRRRVCRRAFSGKVRALISHTGSKVQQAGPSVPVEVIGLPGVPSAGDVFQAVKDERIAREIADDRARKQRAAELAGPARSRSMICSPRSRKGPSRNCRSSSRPMSKDLRKPWRRRLKSCRLTR